MASESVDALIATAYEVPLNDGDWMPVLREIARLTDSVSATFYFAAESDETAALAQHLGLDEDTVRAYHADFLPHDPLFPVAQTIAPGRWYDDRRNLAPRRAEQSVYHQEFLRPRGLATCAGMNLIRAEGQIAGISLQRALGQSHYGDADVQGLERCAAHLMRAARLYQRFAALRSQVALGAAALERQPAPVWVTDGQGHIKLANQAADTLLREERWLSAINGRLTVRGAERLRFAQLLRQAAAEAPAAAQAGAMLLRAHDDSGLSCPATIVPLPAHSPFAAPWQTPLALVTLPASQTKADSAGLLLRQAFSLTEAEARLATMLVTEPNPARCAERLQVSLPTVRTQLRALYAKTEARNLSALIALLARLPL